MAKNFQNNPFDESTKLKLNIFGECFRAWLPVFIHDPFTEQIFIFDFFAGSGIDSEGILGSSLILLNEARGEDRKYCSKAKKKITFIFNEHNRNNINELENNVSNHFENCIKQNQCEKCVYDYEINKSDFKTVFYTEKTQEILQDKNIGKFVLLDQYGFKEIDKDIFLHLVKSPKTDFIFFISSSFIKRFQQHENTKKYIDTEKLNFDESQPKECHRIIAEYFKELIPKDQEYYLHQFTIQKENKGNYYGLIFGTNHTFGMEKFLKVCWNQDNVSGEANYDIDDDMIRNGMTLFNELNTSRKKDFFKDQLITFLQDFRSNNELYKFTLENGCLPMHTNEILKVMQKNERLEAQPSDTRKSSFYLSWEYYKKQEIKAKFRIRK